MSGYHFVLLVNGVEISITCDLLDIWKGSLPQ